MNALTLLLVLNSAFFVFRILYILLYPIDLSPEEAQYWDWSRHPDLSYYSKPPMVAYLNMVSTYFFGDTELGVRITPVLLSFILSLLIFLFMKVLFNDSGLALLSSLLPHILVGTSINSLLMTTDAPFIFFWSLSVMAVYFAVERNTLFLWFLVGILAGFAFLSKYPAVFLLPLTVLYLFLVRRDLLISVKPYLSLIPAFLLSLPVLVWNYRQDFVSFRHVFSLAERDSSFPNWDTFMEFLGGQLLLMSLFPFFFMVYGWWKAVTARDKKLVFLTVYSAPVIIFFALLSLRKEVYANWTGFGYFTGILLSTLFMYKAMKRSMYFFAGLLGFCLFLFSVLHFTPLLDFLGLGSLLPPKRDPVKIMIGWEKLGKEVGNFFTGRELIFSDRYQISAELAFYVEGKPRTYVFHLGRRTQYYLWREGLKSFAGGQALFVSEGRIHPRIMSSFEESSLLREVKVLWRGEVVKRFYIYRLSGFKGEFYESPRGY